jgi:predicted GTPase
MIKLAEYTVGRYRTTADMFEADIIISNGYKMSVLVMIMNWLIRAKHIVIISETPERIPFWWRLLRNQKVFVTSQYIKDKLGYGEIARLGYV